MEEPQTTNDIRADQDALFKIDIFNRIEMFFRRLDIYTEVAPIQELLDVIMAIMIGVLNVLAIATEEIKQGRMSESLLQRINKSPLIEPFSGNYLKRLIGNNDIEGALKRLDRLTQEAARMASAQLLNITNAIDSEVREIADHVLVVDDRVAGVDERIAGVDERVVDSKVTAVDYPVKDVDDEVSVIDGEK
jgi:hypothetical protein